MLIKTYGQYWNPDAVNWGSRGRNNGAQLLGNIYRGRREYEVDFWSANGIYVLFENYKCVYVGRATRGFGPRLKAHYLSDRLTNRWDTFSFYSTSIPVVSTGGLRTDAASRRYELSDVVNALEAVVTLIADPSLNRRREALVGAEEVFQVFEEDSEVDADVEFRSDVLNRLNQLQKRLDSLDK